MIQRGGKKLPPLLFAKLVCQISLQSALSHAFFTAEYKPLKYKEVVLHYNN